MAAANTVEVRKPKVTVGGEATDSIVYQATVPISSFLDGSPTIRYSSHKAGGDRVENPTAKELIEKVATAQAAMFEPPVSNEMVIEDGSGNFTTFIGYDTGPHHDIMFGGVNNGKNLIHRCARLFFINTSIYIPPPPGPGQAQPPTAKAINVIASSANPCAALKLILQDIIKKFLDREGASANTAEFEIRKKIHEANIKIIEEEWYPILDASTESGIPNFAAATANPALQIKIYDTICSVYLSGSADFSVIISQFETMFQMRFIPGHMGLNPGKFIPMAALLSDPEEREVNIVSLSMNPGPRKFLVPTAVAVRGAPQQAPPPVGQAIESSGGAMVVWPETIPEAGQTVVIQMPSWLPSKLFPKKVVKTGTNLDFDTNFQLVETVQQESLDAAGLVQKICLDIARLTYDNISLGDAFASVTCPLDVSWEIGKRYTIKQPSTTSGESSVLFAGFLRAVQHRVSSNPSKAEASTQLTFSHVEANGFTLPNK